MSNYANEAGEPYMTAAQLNFEAALDEQYAEEAWFDRQEAWDAEDEWDEDEDDLDDDGAYDMAEDAAMESGLWGSET
jgi:hypothetical protein